MSHSFKVEKGDKVRSSMFRRPRAYRVNTGSDTPTEQAHKDDCDINKIMARYVKTGQLPDPGRPVGHFLDVTDFGDFQSSMDKVVAARQAFDALPANVREQYRNDPVVYVEAMRRDFEKEEGAFKKKPKDSPPADKPDKDKGA